MSELYYGLLTPDQAPAYHEGQLLLVQGNSDSGLEPTHSDSSTCGEKNIKVISDQDNLLHFDLSHEAENHQTNRNMDSYRDLRYFKWFCQC